MYSNHMTHDTSMSGLDYMTRRNPHGVDTELVSKSRLGGNDVNPYKQKLKDP